MFGEIPYSTYETTEIDTNDNNTDASDDQIEDAGVELFEDNYDRESLNENLEDVIEEDSYSELDDLTDINEYHSIAEDTSEGGTLDSANINVEEIIEDYMETETDGSNSSPELYDYETSLERIDKLDAESSGEYVFTENPYSEKWEQFRSEYSDGDNKTEEWDSLKEVPFGGWSNIPTDVSEEENLDSSNPCYEMGEEWQTNCQRCVPTYEMRLRGYDVSAMPCIDDNDCLAYNPFSVWDNPEVLETTNNGLSEIQNQMREWGDGARAQVVVHWENGDGGHTFTAEQKNGETVFVDPQNGDSDVAWYFEEAKDDCTQFCRIDNLNPNKSIFDCCEGGK